MPEEVDIDESLGLEFHSVECSLKLGGNFRGLLAAHTEPQRKRVHRSLPIDERCVFAQESEVVLVEQLERHRAFSAA